MKAQGLEWDSGNWPKCGKHGVSQAEVEHVIANARFVVDDPNPAEKRLRTAGQVPSGRYVFVVFTVRERGDREVARPISARFMHNKEVVSYEKEMAGIED